MAANLAVAKLLATHKTGLFRIMPEADDWAVRRLRHTAKALELAWPKPMSLEDFEQHVIKAAHRQHRRLQFFDRTSAGPDHPVYSNCLESR